MDDWKCVCKDIKPLVDMNSTSCPELLNALSSVGCNLFFSENSYLLQIQEKTDISKWNITDCSNNCSPLNFSTLEAAGIWKVVADSLERIVSLKEENQLYLPILQVNITNADREMGCSMRMVTSICSEATKRGIELEGLCFSCFEDKEIYDIIPSINTALEYAAEGGQKIKKVMIIGEGIQKMPIASSSSMDLLLELSKKVELSIEASRYFTEKAYTIYTHIIGKKMKHFGEIPHYLYYTDNGVYCSFYNRHINNESLEPIPIRLGDSTDKTCYESTVFGPTCDSIDTLGTTFQLPEMEVGDWFKFEKCGYLCSNYSPMFNGFLDPEEHISNLNVC